MSRYIDADTLTETIRHFVDTMSVCTSTEYCIGLRFMKKQAIEAVESAPTVDAVPVVRCGRCEYYSNEMNCCSYVNGLQNVTKTDYCSYGRCAVGERKDNTNLKGETK